MAGWLRVGYVQGNMNSDNCLVGGVTMDYGPFGFMEVSTQPAPPGSINQAVPTIAPTTAHQSAHSRQHSLVNMPVNTQAACTSQHASQHTSQHTSQHKSASAPEVAVE